MAGICEKDQVHQDTAETNLSAALHLVAGEPENSRHLHRLALLYACRSEYEAARRTLESALRRTPEKAGWWRDYGVVLLKLRRCQEAIEAFWRSLEISPEPRTWAYYAEALAQCGLHEHAVSAGHNAVALAPQSEQVHEDLARVWERLEYWNEAFEAYERVIDLNPDAVDAYDRLEQLYYRFRFDGRAEWCARNLVRLNDSFASSSRLAEACFTTGKVSDALDAYRNALKFEPEAEDLHSAYLRALLHDSTQTGETLRDAHTAWFEVHARPPARQHFANDRNPQRKLRIGYLTGEFKITPAHYFLLPLLDTHDLAKFEVHFYHRAPQQDSSTDEYRRIAQHWHEVSSDTEEALHARIIDGKIDILVDLSGHYADHALGVFARRAAPVQATFPNYPATTGCDQIDYFITDTWTTPDEPAEAQYAEKHVWRLPSGYLSYKPPTDPPDVLPSPAATNGYVTFGLFQRPAKLSEALLQAVAQILVSVPASHLLVQHATRDVMDEQSVLRERILGPLRSAGVDPSRIEFVGLQGVNGFLETVGRVDIALDTFPYSGQTTTCVCLLMGVPVVSIVGAHHMARVSYGLLARMGLDDWVATDFRQYVDLAVRKAADVQQLARLRSTLRERLLRSSICEPGRVTRDLEAAYREMWARWCADGAN